MNKVMLVGRLVRDPDLKFTNKGIAKAFFVIAVKGYYDRRVKDTVDDFIPVIMWGKNAEVLANHAKKGWLVEVEGRLKAGSYERDGKVIYTLEFVAESFEFLSRPRGGEK